MLRALAKRTGATRLDATAHQTPSERAEQRGVLEEFRELGVEVEFVEGATLYPVGSILTKQGTPYKVFTPFWRACQNQAEPIHPLDQPTTLKPPDSWPQHDGLDALQLLPDHPWADEMISRWEPGEKGAADAMESFLAGPAESYDVDRDRPDFTGTSMLSPHLHFGEIGIRRLWSAASDRIKPNEDRDRFLAELGWREFAHHVLYHFPHTPESPLNERYSHFPWQVDEESLNAWQRGMTGYPIVDAGMRQLWRTGWMHNRVRMIVASFLTKHLLQPWQSGARWFWETLVDADLANNTMGWQWAAGCGADATPYFRIFNPVTQGEKFDPEGEYVRQWVPELAAIGKRWIHKPWLAPQGELERAGVVLGSDYPEPVIHLKEGRERALAAFSMFKSSM